MKLSVRGIGVTWAYKHHASILWTCILWWVTINRIFFGPNSHVRPKSGSLGQLNAAEG